MSAAELEACIAFDGFSEEGAHTPAFFIEWLRAIEPFERRRFVLLVTGRVAPAAPPRLGAPPEPSSGTRPEPYSVRPEGVITVRCGQARLTTRPQALRGSWELLLPAYSTYETLATAMEATLRTHGPPEARV